MLFVFEVEVGDEFWALDEGGAGASGDASGLTMNLAPEAGA